MKQSDNIYDIVEEMAKQVCLRHKDVGYSLLYDVIIDGMSLGRMRTYDEKNVFFWTITDHSTYIFSTLDAVKEFALHTSLRNGVGVFEIVINTPGNEYSIKKINL
jgi:hypothetical protein